MRKVLLIVLIEFMATIANAAPVVDILMIAGKSEKNVTVYLGSPSSCSKKNTVKSVNT